MSGDFLDRAAKVRADEALPLDRLVPWIANHLGVTGQPEVTQFTGGASNWTYRLAYKDADLILRRPPAGTRAKSAHDMGREYRLQKALKPHFPLVPNMRAYCQDEAVIGAEFYLMDRIVGIIPRKNLPRGMVLPPNQVRHLCENVLEVLIALHRVDIGAPGLTDLGAGTGYARRQIDGWSRRYTDARTWNVPRGRGIMRWLDKNLPAEGPLCLTHNDFRFDNVVLSPDDPTRVIGVLDWELATIGDPLMDLGNLLAYWVEAGDDRIGRATRRQPTTLPGMMTRAEVIDYYCTATGRDPREMIYYQVYGLFRLSAIAQQIYYRYHKGQTRNPAFRNFWAIVHYLHWRCHRLMRQAR
ncbi:phosphotransferase family protein [Thioclava atlantica]|uniref:Putative aminoglycoside phosphotransferase n=1 Tax=Thioclava atlantica TaxID=1317124 RepID=A0A085TU57_9RHOB|nr:phosphotransferase family protein [Thioclava atlantica]KFE34254.1 putative aminoglycoside phosphotransferase [Thioclava atlantica]